MNAEKGIPQRGSRSLFLTLTRASTGEWLEVAKQGKQTGNTAFETGSISSIVNLKSAEL